LTNGLFFVILAVEVDVPYINIGKNTAQLKLFRLPKVLAKLWNMEEKL